jgi:NTP pyrophosphatase (non-canonical NTP hydrolase)
MTIQEAQNQVHEWIKTYGVRYFDERTNTLLLAEELGEFTRLIAREFGEQSFKKDRNPADIKAAISNEMADMMFVIICLANQMDINLEEALSKNLDKKTKRDHQRHKDNDKLAPS